MVKVSVIMPVYNVEKYISCAIESVLEQTLQEIELICVNDCSPDNSIEIIKEYAKKDSRIKIIDLQENKGQGNARNIGIQSACGKYVLFLDPDDWCEKNACEILYDIAELNNANVVQGIFRSINEATKEEKVVNFFESFSKKQDKISPDCFVDIKKMKKTTFRTFGLAPWGKLYLLDFLKKNDVKFALCRRGEDHCFTIDVKLRTPIFYTNSLVYNYLVRENSASTYVVPLEEIISATKSMLTKHKKSFWIKNKFDEYVISLVFKYRKEIDFYGFLFRKDLLSIKQKTILLLKNINNKK